MAACHPSVDLAAGGVKSLVIFGHSSVQLGQRLLVTNRENECSQPCIVVFVGVRLGGGFDVAFSFTAAMMHFWEKPGPRKIKDKVTEKAPSNEIEVHCRAVEFAQQ